MTLRERLEQELEDLRTTRDELRVRVHLGKMGAEEQWEQIERQWHHLESRLKIVGETGREIAEDVGEAASHAIAEIKEGYSRLRKML